MKKYKYLIFDLDNTLIDNVANLKNAFGYVLKEKGISYTEELFERWDDIFVDLWSKSVSGELDIPNQYNSTVSDRKRYISMIRCKEFFDGEIDVYEAFKLANIYKDNSDKLHREVEGASKILEHLSRDYSIIVATNASNEEAIKRLQGIGCLNYVDIVFSAHELEYVKPFKEFYTRIIKLVKIESKDDCLAIGDQLRTDIKGAMNAEIDSVWLDHGRFTLTDEFKPTFTIKYLNELESIL